MKSIEFQKQKIDNIYNRIEEKMGELNITSIYCDPDRQNIVHIELCECKEIYGN